MNKRSIQSKQKFLLLKFLKTILVEILPYSGRFDFVLYEKDGRTEIPILAIELTEEHRTNENRIKCDQAKELICDTHDFTLIRIPNSYARRYSHIKEILLRYFKK